MGFNSPFVFAASTCIVTGNESAAIAVVRTAQAGTAREMRKSRSPQARFGDHTRACAFRASLTSVGERLTIVDEPLTALWIISCINLFLIISEDPRQTWRRLMEFFRTAGLMARSRGWPCKSWRMRLHGTIPPARTRAPSHG